MSKIGCPAASFISRQKYGGRRRLYVRRIKASESQAPAWRWRLAQAIEIRWWRRYLGGRDPDQYLTWKRSYWCDFLEALNLLEALTEPNVLSSRACNAEYAAAAKPAPTRPRVLDAGCGPAGIFLVLNGCKVVAVDPLLPAYKSLQHFRPHEYPWVSFETKSLEMYSADEAYDYVFCLNVINHVRDLAGVMVVLAKALRPDGTLILSVDAHRHASLKRIFRAVPGDVLHPHQHDLTDYEAQCAKAGLRVIERLLYRRERIFDYWVLRLKLVE